MNINFSNKFYIRRFCSDFGVDLFSENAPLVFTAHTLPVTTPSPLQFQIGNVLYVHGEQIVVDAILNKGVTFTTIYGKSYALFEEVKSIPLTAELIEGMGFQKTGGRYKLERWCLKAGPSSEPNLGQPIWWHFGVTRNFDGEEFFVRSICHIHELQNILNILSG